MAAVVKMNEINSQALHVVAKELTVTLADARVNLEAYAERFEQRAMLEKCAEQLHVAHGVLRLVEVYGAALLAEEMEHVATYLLDVGNDEKRLTDGLDALMRSMVQLPTYLDRVLSGGRDLALILLPLLNDLRAVRGNPLLSEGTLMLLNLKSDESPVPQAAPAQEAGIGVAQWARRLRPRFQVALLGLIRGDHTEQNLAAMAGIAAKLEQLATTQTVFQFWWVTGAVFEALQAHGLEPTATIKRLLGHVDRQIRNLHEQGEVRYAENPPTDLLNNLLYYVARASTGGGRIDAVRTSFKLSELLPIDPAIEQERASLSAPSIKLMRTVAVAIKEDLAKVKDVLDIFVRRGSGQTEELRAQLDLLKKISDTLGVLGLGELRQRIQHEITELNTLLTGGLPPPESALLKVAEVLLAIEDNLDEQLVRLILPQADTDEPVRVEAVDHDFRLVSEAVLRECIVNLARIKEAVSLAVQKPGELAAHGFDNVAQLLRGINAGLLMLGKTRAVELMDAIGAHIRRLVEAGAPVPDALRVERIADAIVSLEYYMETIQSGRTDPWYMLDNAETCIRALSPDERTRLPFIEPPTVEVAALAPTSVLRPLEVTPAPADYAATVKIQQPAYVPTVVMAAPIVAAAPPPAVSQATDSSGIVLDPDLVKLFIEEATEELVEINRQFPLWEENLADVDSLASLRRSFHTLKGSGRMVGARVIGDFAWSIENLLNRLLAKTLACTPGMVALLRSAIETLPQLIALLEHQQPVTAPFKEIMASAFAYADGKGPDQALPAEEPEARIEAPAPATPVEPIAAVAVRPEPMDPVLHEIYSKETANHLDEIRAYLRGRAGQPAPHELPEAVYRAIHTLSGSSKMAEARHGIRITEPLNQYMRKVFDSGRGLPDAGLALLADVVTAIETVVSHIDEATGFFSDHAQLQERMRQLEAELDAEQPPMAEDTQLAPVLRLPLPEEPLPEVLPADPVAGVAPPVLAAQDPAPQDDFDHEIANIYGEEATELLEAAQVSLAAWNRDRRNTAPVTDLQRQLHTLKGGARMAGIAAMGDLSHELETLVIHIDTGQVAADDAVRGLLQASLDELARMRDTVANGRLPAMATQLLAQIRARTAGEPLPAETPPPLVSVPAAAITVTPPVLLTAPAELPVAVSPASSEPVVPLNEAAPVSFEGMAPPVLPGREAQPQERTEMARVDADLLDTMLNNAGEVSIFRARLDQQVSSIDFNLVELGRTVTRLKEQLRSLEIETEAQVLNRHRGEEPRRTDFDPLELDRYSAIQQYSRALAETSGDVASIQGLLESLAREAQTLLSQQSRVITELQNSLMRTRMVPFQRHVQRLTRLVRQAANDTGKRAELIVEGAAAELDRQSLERMVPPLEHMLRNAIVHGIEPPEQRVALGKPEAGRITISLERDGAEIIIVVTDDGAGIDVRLIREKAIALGLADPQAKLTDEEAMQLILEPGFSTAGRVTQSAGRGVGMDVVATEVKKLGGGLFIESTVGAGSRFTIRLPFTLAISQALIVRVGEELFALPLATVEGVLRLPRNVVVRHLGKDAPPFEYGGQKYRFQQLGTFVGLGSTPLPEADVSMSVALIRAGEHSTALVTDELVGSREIVVKSLGPQISGIRGIGGATILGDGRIVIILDMGALVRSEWRARVVETPVVEQRDRRIFALVVDDSITVRRVTQRLLERNGMKVLTAKDGIEALSVLQDNLPDIILLDIEMPRMDGYEVAAHVRNDPRLQHIPIVMITSRVSDKHRARAIELGVDEYLGKPYQESQLLDAIEPLVARRNSAPAH